MKKTSFVENSPDFGLLSKELARLCTEDALVNLEDGHDLPTRQEMKAIVALLLDLLFPGVFGAKMNSTTKLEEYFFWQLNTVSQVLVTYVHKALVWHQLQKGLTEKGLEQKAKDAVFSLVQKIPTIRAILKEDLIAAYEGDPAAASVMEVLVSYPCVEAIATQRLAHVLYNEGVPLIPRMMSEVAHGHTGIDIHPGAQIGPGFFIDHGTGVVIGETCVIGKHVKMYQGVTLGALSFVKDSEGNLVKGIKRHPNIEDNVVIYAEATVLGGDTTIGKGSIIGGNCWITKSVAPGTKLFPKGE